MRQAIAQFLLKSIIVIGVPCLIAAKLHVMPKRVNRIALWGPVLCFVLALVRLALLAFGD